jgi:hypothetical protein
MIISSFLYSSYPSMIVVPADVGDESLRKTAKGFKHNRFPIVTWMSANGALLIRGAGFVPKTVASRMKHGIMLGAGSQCDILNTICILLTSWSGCANIWGIASANNRIIEFFSSIRYYQQSVIASCRIAHWRQYNIDSDAIVGRTRTIHQ